MNATAPISTLAEFNHKYALTVNNRMIRVIERTNDLVLAEFTTEEPECKDPLSHFNNGFFYFVLAYEGNHRNKHVYRFDPNDNSIESIAARLKNPHFVKNRLVEFGTGFNAPGRQAPYRATGEGIIQILDLGLPRDHGRIQTIYVEGGSSGGWDGSIDGDQIVAFDHVRGTRREFPIFE